MPGISASGLKTQIKSYTETDSNVLTNDVLENIILNAQYRIFRDVPIDADRKQQKINIVEGIKIIGVKSLMNSLPLTASNLYAKNLFSFIRNLYSKERKDFNINLEDEIIEKSLIKEV